ncbi:pirin family protein [Streptomyces coeruleorubidus]|uniref:pirin family protein n=1 Tax=Streptomyces coeruleorubidus TaxID=116188 RepID=UPI0036C335D0
MRDTALSRSSPKGFSSAIRLPRKPGTPERGHHRRVQPGGKGQVDRHRLPGAGQQAADACGVGQIKPGQLHLMTAGGGVAHAEEATGHYRGTLEGIQLWIALPETTRQGPAAFDHHTELPQADLDGGAGAATVLVGDFTDLASPARHDTPQVGTDLDLRAPATVPLRTDFEYVLIVLEGVVAVHGRPLLPGRLGYLGEGRDELHLQVRQPARAILLGGEPFPEPILMWWNFVARTRAEIDAAHASWSAQDERFGRVRSGLPLIAARPLSGNSPERTGNRAAGRQALALTGRWSTGGRSAAIRSPICACGAGPGRVR